MDEGRQKKNYKLRGKTCTIGYVKKGKTGKTIDLGKNPKFARLMISLCDNIWLHRGWHAPCELPRMHSSSALVVGLWILAQNFRLRKIFF